ncbi:MAG: hypothetical protein KC550_02140, partial [Nanoarchaeota archaeon]|nr:hypothetical protein [Nanoarchaeota archaeon]
MAKLKTVLFFILILISFNFAFSADAPVCCYDGQNIVVKANCDSNSEMFVGNGNTDTPSDFCGAYKTRKACELSSGTCVATSGGGNIIYNGVIDNLPTSLFDFSDCVNFVDYDNSCVGDSTGHINTGETGGGGTQVEIITDENPFDDYVVEHNNTFDPDTIIEIASCSNAGGPFGYFVTKESCESIKDANDEEICLYNPFRSGFVSTIQAYDKSGIIGIDINSPENVCIYKKQIKSCDQYKTKDNCDGNRADLDDSCKWINSNEFSNVDVTDKTLGMCISNFIDNNKNFNRLEYYSRGNLLKNPSFEDADMSVWGAIVQKNDPDAYNGNFVVELSSGNKLNQDILFPKEGRAYSPYLYIKYDTSSQSNALVLSLSAYDFNNVLIPGNSYTSQINLVTLPENKFDGIYERVLFNTYVVPKNTAYLKYELTFTGDKNLDIDALSFEETASVSANLNKLIFKPEEIIGEKASNCNRCFEKSTFNVCTQEKSDYLGDCSYMVGAVYEKYESSLQFYLGGVNMENSFLGNPNDPKDLNPWLAQSLANSNLFCELYTIQSQCENPNNYVNSKFSKYHLSSGNTLCKWNPVSGCFKDSNNDNFPDTRVSLASGFPKLWLASNYPDIEAAFNSFSEYKYSTDDAGASDFAYSCDILPPVTYIYLVGRDSSGNPVTITENTVFAEGIGNLDLHLDLQDQYLESCSKFDFEEKLYVDYKINGNPSYFKVDSSQYNSHVSVKNQLRHFETGEIMIKDGANNIQIRVFDQSGNIGKDWSFDLPNVDASAPNITLVSPEDTFEIDGIDTIWVGNGPFGKSTNFNFNIKDSSDFICNFQLSPNSEEILDIYYDHEILNFTASGPEKDFIYKLNDYIYNTSEVSNSYDLEVSCSDIYGQTSTKKYQFKVDFYTSLIVLEPLSFVAREAKVGFLNGPTQFNAISSELGTPFTCSFDFDAQYGLLNSALSVESFEKQTPFYVENYVDEPFFQNVTGILEFSSDGLKNGSVTCTDSKANSFSEKLIYYYDTVAPKKDSFELINTISGNINNVLEVGGQYYTRTADSSKVKARLFLDGTNSWISHLDNLIPKNADAQVLGVNYDGLSYNDNFKTNVTISNYENPLLYIGEETAENKLYKKEFTVDVHDKAGNMKPISFSYFFDNSNPGFNFSGDIAGQDDGSNRIFTKNANPNFEIGFNTPSYRKFACTVKAKKLSGQVTYQKKFASANKLIFNLAQININSLKNGESVLLSFDCIDDYGVRINDIYTLTLDTVPPILDWASFYNGNSKYLPKVGSISDALVDKLQMSLIDTGEIGYVCKYWFESNSNYQCSNDVFSIDFSSSGIQSTPNLNILDTGFDVVDNLICTKTDSLKSKLNNPSLDKIKTSIVANVQCFDLVNQATDKKLVEMNITYVENAEKLIDLDFEFGFKEIFPIVKSFTAYDKVAISYNSDGSNPLMILSNPKEKINADSLNEYVYKSVAGISFDNLKSGDNLIYAVALASDNTPFGDFVSNNVYIDNKNPEVELEIFDIVEGKVYSQIFPFRFEAQDLKPDGSNGKLSDVSIYANGNLIFSTSEISNYDSAHLDSSALDLSAVFDKQGSHYEGILTYVNASIGQEITLKVVATDEANNIGEMEITVLIM